MTEPPRRSIKDCIDAAVALNEDIEFGPAHLVIGDYELSDNIIHYCLSIVETLMGLRGMDGIDISAREYIEWAVAEYTRSPLSFFEWYRLFDKEVGLLPVTRNCLLELLTIPEAEREAFEEDE